jgi:hypothetical protein
MRHRLVILIGAVLLVWAVSFLGLYIDQGRHNHLPLSLADAYPEEDAFRSGEVFALTLATIMDHELNGTFGWRPNDFILWSPTLWADNNANRQLGIIQGVRETVRVFKDHLTKVSSDEYDPDLLQADTLFRNDANKIWFPSAENRFRQGVERLQTYTAGLKSNSPRTRPIAVRNVELIRLFQAWTDLLGDAHANLYKEREADGSSVWWHTDDYFYRVQGYAHVMYHVMLALKREYPSLLKERPSLAKLFDETTAALEKAALMNPLVILNGSPSGIFANHRRNLDGYIAEARQKMYSIREELEK